MLIFFKSPSINSLEKIRSWRNNSLESLRTPYPLTKEMQEKFYNEVVCSRQTNSRWWDIFYNNELIGFCGLANIEWENRLAEISLILAPTCRDKNHINKVLNLILYEGFNNMNLANIYGECYECNPLIDFWKDFCGNYKATCVVLPNRKYWNGQYWNSFYFNFERGLFSA